MVKNLHISILLLTFAIGIVGLGHPMTRAKLAPPFPFVYLGQDLERACIMRKKRELCEVIKDFKKVHGDKYDYSLITEENYIDTNHKVLIVCKTCGNVFPQIAKAHKNGQGCKICASLQNSKRQIGSVKKKSRLVYGVGINDYDGCVHEINGVNMESYASWQRMLYRCYGLKRYPSYVGCSVCDEWLHFSNFKKWFDENYVEGYQLDKDILVKGNKVYSPTTCCFVPPKINYILLNAKRARHDLPLGVHRVRGGKFYSTYSGKHIYLGTFNTSEEAFQAYKQAKEAHIQEVATQYYNDGKITEKVYNALMNYKVEITD